MKVRDFKENNEGLKKPIIDDETFVKALITTCKVGATIYFGVKCYKLGKVIEEQRWCDAINKLCTVKPELREMLKEALEKVRVKK